MHLPRQEVDCAEQDVARVGYLVALAGDGGQPCAKDRGCKIHLLTDPLQQRTNSLELLGLAWSRGAQECRASVRIIVRGDRSLPLGPHAFLCRT